MPKLNLYHSGCKAALSSRPTQTRGKRAEINGWSQGSAARCDLFLRSVRFDQVEAMGVDGYAITLTVAVRPPSHRHWQRCVKRLVDRFRSYGLRLSHYVTEWQPRGRSSDGPCPHLHMVAFFDGGRAVRWSDGFCSAYGAQALAVHWLEVANDFDPLLPFQHVVPVTDVRGWFRYLAKHAARGVLHYQRGSDQLPKGWEKTGRMWGKTGDWPVFHVEAQISLPAFYALRRFTTGYLRREADRMVELSRERLRCARGVRQVKDAEKVLAGAVHRAAYLRRRLRRSSSKIGRLVPVSDWVPVPLLQTWLERCCVFDERVDLNTGEFVRHYRLPGEIDPSGLRAWLMWGSENEKEAVNA